MHIIKTYISMFFLAGIAMSCGSPGQSETSDSETEVKAYKIYKAPASPAYEDATLTLIAPTGTLDTGNIMEKFDVTNFEMGAQTSDAQTRGIANSGKGQHIHFIVNNEPYSAHYEPEFSNNFGTGNYVILAFLSRSYHESVKNPNAFVLTKVTVGQPETTMEFDASAPHLFYSRPKGTYSGADTEKLMLDFYLVNTTLSPDGNKVKANINGQEEILTEWAPYYIEGLGKGEVTIKLELIDADGNWIPGPFNRVERKVILE